MSRDADTSVGCHTIGSRLQHVCALVELPDLSGKVTLVTGGTSGVGRALVEQLARAGAAVMFTARDVAKGARVRAEVQAATGNEDVTAIDLDLARFGSIRAGAAAIAGRTDRLDLLICNAAHQAGKQRTVTADGFETTFGVNHLGHALLIQRLEGLLVDSAPSCILVVASEAHRRSRGGLDFDDLMLDKPEFQPRVAYGRSKLANILYARALAKRLAGSGVTVRSAHPGAVDTPMMRANFVGPLRRRLYPLLGVLLISPDDSAAGLLRVALDPELTDATGEYYEVGVRKDPPADALGDAVDQLWSVTEGLIRTDVDVNFDSED